MKRLLVIGLSIAALAVPVAAFADPPEITVPADMTVEAQSVAGAVVTYTVTAANRGGRPVPVECAPASGSTFPLGTTTVTCTATDDEDTRRERFEITVVDRTPPALTVPANKSLRTKSRRGIVVNFQSSATDIVDGAVAPTCTPPSGSLFVTGSTEVTCTAADRRGNVATGSFTITIAVVRTVSRAALFYPAAGARLSRPPMLAWRPVRNARFYNVQVYRSGRKVLTRWPTRPRLGLRRTWKHRGRTFRLRPGVYTWFVWPAFGTKANPRYGKLVGQSSFRIV